MHGYTEETGITSGAHKKQQVLPPRPKPSCRDPAVKLPVPPATPGTSESHDSPPAAPVQKPPAKPSVPSVQNMQNKQDTSPPVTTTRSGRVVRPPACFADH